MRCPSCNKFVSLETEINDSPENEDLSCDEKGYHLEFDLRIQRVCAECGGEMKECYVHFEAEDEWPKGSGYSEEEIGAADVSFGDVEPQESGGGRYAKNMIGALVTFDILIGKDKISGEADASEPASSFEEVA